MKVTEGSISTKLITNELKHYLGMKKLIWIIVGMMVPMALTAQNWKTQLERVGQKPSVKTIRIRTGFPVTLGTLLPEANSIKENRYYYGNFLGATADSMKISLNEVRVNKNFSNGIRTTETIPVKVFLNDPSRADNAWSLALTDIHQLKFEKPRAKASEAFELGLFASLAVLVVSPFICINYRDMTFNANRYQYFALGSTAGLVASVTYGIVTGSGRKQYQLKQGWPLKKAKVWKFR